MSMSKMSNRASKQPHIKTPTAKPPSQSTDDTKASATEPQATTSTTVTPMPPQPSMESGMTEPDVKDVGEKDNPLPEPEETSQQAIPTPELLFLRRATKHMPIPSLSSDQSKSPPTSPPPLGLTKRRSTVNPKGLLPAEESPAFPQVFENEGIPDFVQKNIAKRRSTLQVPSKLAM